MGWDERQQAMLREMGLRLWLPAAPPAAAAAPAAQPAAAPAAPAAAAAAAAVMADAAPPATAADALGARPAAAVAAGTPEARAAVAAPSPVPMLPAPLIPGAAAPVPTAADDARAAAIARLPWPALRQAVAGCTACRLCETRTQTVFGSGHPQAQWLVVGEAPGEQEDRTGEPFVGPAGQLLDRMLAALQLTRAAEGDGDAPTARRVFVANTLKCRPPRNRNPMPDELALCEPYLQRQIALLQPRMILAMGAFALKLLLRTDAPVGRLRGHVHRYQGVPLVATYHPAYLLRQPAEKAKSWADLCLAADHFVPREGDDGGL